MKKLLASAIQAAKKVEVHSSCFVFGATSFPFGLFLNLLLSMFLPHRSAEAVTLEKSEEAMHLDFDKETTTLLMVEEP